MTRNEEKALQAINSYATVIASYCDKQKQFHVYMGSHGASAGTLVAAMRRCLQCCAIGKYWMLGDKAAYDTFKDIAENILHQEWKPMKGAKTAL